MNVVSLHYSYDLLTPRKDIADKDPNLRRSPLVTSQRFRRVEAVYDTSPKEFSDTVEAADEIGNMVRQTLSFGSMVDTNSRLWSWDKRTDALQTNCFGHAIVASELMDAVGIQHYISFVNGHSFVTIFDNDNRQAHMVDPPTKELFLDIDSSVMGVWPNTLFQQNPELKCVTNMINTSELIANIVRKPRSRILFENPWLTKHTGKIIRPEDTEDSNHILVMRTYPSEAGRDVLVNYGMAMEYLSHGSVHSALDRFRQLEGLYPDIEARNGLALATRLRHTLFQEDLFDEMEDVGRVVDASLPKSGPVNLPF